MAITADAIILATTQAAIKASEEALAAALAHQNIKPTVFIATVTSHISVMMSQTTAVASNSGTRSYCWTHGTTLSLRHNSTTCHDKMQGHRDDATKGNTLGVSTNVWDPRT
jgi:hypothetical protein